MEELETFYLARIIHLKVVVDNKKVYWQYFHMWHITNKVDPNNPGTIIAGLRLKEKIDNVL